MSKKMCLTVNPLLLAVLVFIIKHAQAFLTLGIMADIYLCENPTKLLTLSTQDTVKLCCGILPDYCPSNADNTSDTSDVFMKFLPRGVNASDQLYLDLGLTERRVNACTIELAVKYPPPGKVTFDCFWDGFSNIYHEDVHFVADPVKPNITEVVTTAKKIVTVKFDRGDPNSDAYYDNYTVTLVGPDNTCGKEQFTEVMCHWNSGFELDSPLCEDNICTCKKDFEGNVCQANYTIIINVSRPLASVTTTEEINLVKYVRPQAMKSQSAEVLSPYEAEVLFCLKSDTLKLTEFVDAIMDPMVARVVLDKRQGIPQTSTLEIDLIMYNRRCILVSLTNLTPFTNYIFTTSAIAGGGEGNPTVTEFTTHKTAPLAPPVIDEGMYRWTDMTLSNGTSQMVLILSWQELPQASRGGGNVSYDLELWSDELCVFNQSEISKTYKVVDNKLPSSSLTVKLWARNEIGRSENFSTLLVPSIENVVPVVYQVELSEHMAHIHIQKSTLTTTNQKLLVHICQDYDRVADLDLCKNNPETRKIDLSQAIQSSNNSSMILTVPLASYPYYTTTSREEPTTYYLLEDKNDKGRTILRRSMAVIETQQVMFSDIPPPSDGSDDMGGVGSGNGAVTVDDEDSEDEELNGDEREFSDEEHELSKREAIHRTNSRKPRDVAKVPLRQLVKLGILGQNQAANVGSRHPRSSDYEIYKASVSRRHLLSTDVDTESDFTVPPGVTSLEELPVLDDSLISKDSTDSLYRLFVSQNTEDGSLLGQSTPQCYYSEQSDEVDVKVVAEIREGSVAWVHLFQDCDQQPRQFLVDLYQVYVSEDDLCQNVKLVGEVKNSLFEPTEVQLPQGSKVACVRALRLASESVKTHSSDFTAQPINLEYVDTVNRKYLGTILAIVLPLGVILVGIIIAIGAWKYRQKSQKAKAGNERIQKLIMEEGESTERLQYPPIRGLNCELPEPPNMASAVSGNDLSNTDSGMFTHSARSEEGLNGQRGGSHTSTSLIGGDASGSACEDGKRVDGGDSGSDNDEGKENEDDTRQEIELGDEPTQDDMLPQGFVVNVKHCEDGEEGMSAGSGGTSNSSGSSVSWSGWGDSGDSNCWSNSGDNQCNDDEVETCTVRDVSREHSDVLDGDRKLVREGNEVGMRERLATTIDGLTADKDSTEMQDNKLSSESVNAPAYSRVTKVPDPVNAQTNVPDQQMLSTSSSTAMTTNSDQFMWSSPSSNMEISTRLDNKGQTTISDQHIWSPQSINMKARTAQARTRNDSGLGPGQEDEELRSSVSSASLTGVVVDCPSDCESGGVWSRTNSCPGEGEEGEGCSSPRSGQFLLFDAYNDQHPLGPFKGFDDIRYRESQRPCHPVVDKPNNDVSCV